MKKSLLLIAALAVLASACAKKETPAPVKQEQNPLLVEWTAPFGTPPFDQIKEAHFRPAFDEGMARQKKEIEAIAAAAEPATFANTIEAMEYGGALLSKVGNVFGALTENNTSEALQKVQAEMAPILSKHGDDIALNAKLFERVKAVYDKRDALNLAPEQARLLEETYKGFVRSGAALDEAKKAELRKVNEELAVLSQKFGENVLAEDNGFKLVLDKKEDLAGLPDDVITSAAEEAKAAGKEGQWVFSLHKPSCIPFFQYSSRRDLREKLFKAFISRGANGNDHDNRAIASKIAALRASQPPPSTDH